MNTFLFCLFVLLALFGLAQAQENCHQETFCYETTPEGLPADLECEEVTVCDAVDV